MTSQNGIGSMLHSLRGGSQEDPAKYVGRRIIAAELTEHDFGLSFSDGVTIRITDEGQSCCERRYMTCDDDLKHLLSSTLTDIVVAKVEDHPSDGEAAHEIAFLEIRTDKGVVTVCTHNENNGYYGGFALNIWEMSQGAIS